jgi:hypothetical protein
MTDITLWIDPPSYHTEGDRLFDITEASGAGDNILAPYVHLREVLNANGVSVHTADLLDGSLPQDSCNLYVSTGTTKRFRRIAQRGDVIMSAFFVLECPVVARSMFARLPEASRVFRRMFAFNDGSALTPFLKEPVNFEPIHYPYAFAGVDGHAWSCTERSFIAMINANKALPPSEQELYTERLRAIEFFARTGELDLYGMGWEGPAYRVGRGLWIPGAIRRLGRQAEHALNHLRPDPRMLVARKVWKGPVKSKLDVLSRYKFSICIENQQLDGWVTEKMFDCMRAGCVPVYLGAPDVERWVPPECFVDMRSYDGFRELGSYLRSVSDRDLQTYRDAGREFLGSEQFRPFTKAAFADLFASIVAEDAAVHMDARVAA